MALEAPSTGRSPQGMSSRSSTSLFMGSTSIRCDVMLSDSWFKYLRVLGCVSAWESLLQNSRLLELLLLHCFRWPCGGAHGGLAMAWRAHLYPAILGKTLLAALGAMQSLSCNARCPRAWPWGRRPLATRNSSPSLSAAVRSTARRGPGRLSPR